MSERVRSTRRAITAQSFRKVRRSALAIGVTFGALAASSAMTYADSFPTEASRQALVASFSGGGGFSVLFGQVDAIDTVGGYTAYKTFVTVSTIGAVWALLAATRLLRGEEDAGRWQLLLAGRTDPRHATRLTLGALYLAILVVFVLTTTLTAASGTKAGVSLPLAGCLAFGIDAVLAAVVFAAVGALCSQLAQTRRVATTLGVGVLGVAFILRMVADSGPDTHWLLWSTPLGWVELIDPFTTNDPRPALLGLLTAAALCAGAVSVAGRRDVGHGIVAAGETATLRPVGLRTPLGLATRLTAPLLAAWTFAIVATSFVLGLVAAPAAQALADSSNAGTTISRFGVSGTTATSYLGLAFLFTGAVLALVPASQIAGARDEESSGRLIQVLAAPPSRRGWLVGRIGLAAATVGVLGLLAGITTWAGAASQGLSVDVTDVTLAGVNLVPPALLALAIGALVLAVAPRLAPAAIYFVVAWSFVVDLLGSLVSRLSWIVHLSLFHYVKLAPAVDPDWTAGAIYLALAVALALVAIALFEHRDLSLD